MSKGHHIDAEPKTAAQAFAALGTGDTSELYGEPYTIVTNRDIAYTGGVSVDRKRVYVDQTFYRDVMSGKIKIEGLQPQDIIAEVTDHEHSEKSVEDGDNPFDDYLGSHGIAEAKGDHTIDQKLGKGGASRYEKQLRPHLDACTARFIKLGDKANPPTDLWCGPYLDDEDDDDRKILAILKAKGVTDAFKASKSSAHYGMGSTECQDCRHFAPTIKQEQGKLGDCEEVCGMVRWDRSCDWWEEKGKR